MKKIPANASSFSQSYIAYCQVHSLPVSPDILSPFLESELALYLEIQRIKRDEDYIPVIKALKKDTSLKSIILYSDALGDVTMTRNFNSKLFPSLLNCIRDTLSINRQLTKLDISGIPLTIKNAKVLANGISASKCIQSISLARSSLGDSGLKLLAPAFRSASASLSLLDLSGCDLSSKGALILSNMLKSQFVKRQSVKWQQSLRDQEPTPDMEFHSPLQRLTLVHNHIGDEGLDFLMDLLTEEIGLLVMDIQDNQITNLGAKIVLNVLQLNTEIQIIDIRNNLNIDTKLLESIHDALGKNRMFSILKAQKSQNTVPHHWNWLDAKNPLKHTFHEMNSKMHVRSQTQATLKKRSVKKPRQFVSKNKLNSSLNPKKGNLPGPIVGSILGQEATIKTHENNSLVIDKLKRVKKVVPLNSKNFRIESAEPCHKLYIEPLVQSKSKPISSSLDEVKNGLIKENQELRQRLALLESGIASVTQVLQINQENDKESSVVNESKSDSLKQLIDLMEKSLMGFHDMMDSLESREKERRSRKEARRRQKLIV